MKIKNIGIVFIGIAILILYIASETFLAAKLDLPQTIGNLLGLLLLIYLVGKFLIRKKSDEIKERLLFLIGTLSIIWSLAVVYLEFSSYKNINKSISNLEEGRTDLVEQKTSNAPIKIPGYSASTVSQIDYLLQLVLQASQPYTLEINKQTLAFSKIPLEKILSVDIYQNKSALNASLGMLKEVESYYIQHIGLEKQMFNARIEAVEKAAVSSKVKDEFISGMTKSNKRSMELMHLQVNESRKMMTAARKILSLAEANFGMVRIIGDTVSFPSERDNEIYNREIAVIIKAAEEEQRLRNEILKFQESNMNAMKAVVK
jgi:hypothetical protein